MSEVATRGSAARGRGGYRGSRGGHSTRGGRGGSSRHSGTDKALADGPALEDQGEIGQLKSKYASSIKIVKEMFPDWSPEDIVFAIEENEGDLERTINKMTEGNVSQWGEVKKKDKTKVVKAKDGAHGEVSTGAGRSGRGRGGAESVRGGRGRATDRGRGASRGARGGSVANGRTAKNGDAATGDATGSDAVAPADVNADTAAATTAEAASPSASWEVVTPSEVAAAPVEAPKANAKPEGSRTWANLLRPAPQPKPAPVTKSAAHIVPSVPKAEEAPSSAAIEPTATPETPAGITPAVPAVVEPAEQLAPSAPPSLPPSESNNAAVAPSEDKLTEENLEQVKDVSQPVASETVASTMGTEDATRSAVGTPLHGQGAQPVRPGLGGFATSAIKATQGRVSSFRKVKDQQEAVVMPGNHAVDRTAVQFGSLGLGAGDEVDEDREEAETRTQPPQHSPIAPRASLPAAQQAATESAPTPRAASNVPSTLPQVQTEGQNVPPTQAAYDQFSNRFGGLPGAQAPGATNVSKPYEPFGQQLAGAGQHPFDNYASQTQAPGQQAQTAQSNLGGFGSGYDSYYNDFQRNAPLYGGFGHQSGQAQTSSSDQRTPAGFGTSAADQAPQHATSHAPQNRFGGVSESLSGHSTPAPAAGQGTQGQQQGQGHHQSHQQSHHVGGHGQASGPYGYNQYAQYQNAFQYNQQMANPAAHQHQSYGRERPAFDDARRYEDSYGMSGQNHYGYGGYGGYGTGPYSGGKYSQPHQYSSQYDSHGASQGSFGRDAGAGGFGYGRTGSTQPDASQQGQHASTTYGGMNDPFARSTSGFHGQASTQGPTDENSRYGTDSSKIATGGPSPAPGQQRPDSTAAANQSGPPHSQQGYGSYPQNLGGFGSGHQGGHQGGHSGFGAGYGYSYGSGNRGGWSGYGGH